MANKKRKLTKETERLQLIRLKKQKERAKVLCVLAFTCLAAVLVAMAREYLFKMPLDIFDFCILAAILTPVFISVAIVVVYKTSEIRETDERIEQSKQALRDWNLRLEEL